MLFGDQLGQISADDDELDADADAGDETPEIEPERSRLESHDRVRHAIPEQRNREDGAAPVGIGKGAASTRADEQA